MNKRRRHKAKRRRKIKSLCYTSKWDNNYHYHYRTKCPSCNLTGAVLARGETLPKFMPGDVIERECNSCETKRLGECVYPHCSLAKRRGALCIKHWHKMKREGDQLFSMNVALDRTHRRVAKQIIVHSTPTRSLGIDSIIKTLFKGGEHKINTVGEPWKVTDEFHDIKPEAYAKILKPREKSGYVSMDNGDGTYDITDDK